MGLTADNSTLGMMLPLRSGMDLGQYLQRVMPEFPDSLPFADAGLCKRAPMEAVVLSSNAGDLGHPYRFLGCDPDTQDLLLTPKRAGTLGEGDYRRALLFLEEKGSIILCSTALKYLHKDSWCFSPPSLLYRRRTRQDKRVRISGQIIVRFRDGRTVTGDLYDFSPSGASFYTDEPFRLGETLLAEFAVPDCGICETVVTTAREARLSPNSPSRYLVGIKMQLTAAQRKKAEQLYLCKKADTMKQVVDSARSRNG